MRVRVYRAWASNNSGAYVLVGRFYDAATAEAAAREMNDALAAHDAWAASRGEGLSPFVTFARTIGVPVDEWIPWDQGMRCEVLDQQILLEGYAAEMPPTFVALVARHGGHVEVELVHAHGAIVAIAHAWMPDAWAPDRRTERLAALARFVDRVQTDADLIASLVDAQWSSTRRRGIHAIDDARGVDVIVAPHDVTRATRAIRACARAEGLDVRFRVLEWVDQEGDPAAILAEPARRSAETERAAEETRHANLERMAAERAKK